MTTAQQTTDTNAPAPPPDPDAAAYAALAKELDIEPAGGEQEPPQPAPQGQEPPAAEKPAEKPQPTEADNLRAALREAREATKTEQARTDAILEALKAAKERRQEQPEEKKPAEPKLPDVQADPIGYMLARFEQLEKQQQQASQGGQQDNQQIRQHLQEQAMWTTVEASEREIRNPQSPAHKADYDDACRHLEGARVKQLDRMYPSDHPQVQALARQHGFANANDYKLSLLDQDRRAVAVHALQTGISPAQLYYDLALDSGYQPKANGKTQPPAQQAEKQIDAMRNGVKAAVTLSGDGGGRKGAQDMSVADLTQLFEEDPEAADKLWDQMHRAGRLG